jgi:hypothetical protein
MKKVAVAVIHGMGHDNQDFADGFMAAIEKNLASRFADSVGWIPLHWGNLLDHRQKRYWKRANASARLDWQDCREFVVNTLGDAIAYRETPDGLDSVYNRVCYLIKKSFHTSWRADFKYTNPPLIWVAHSLGCQVMSNFIWDTMRDFPDVSDDASFLRQQTIRGVFTTGATLPLFTFANAKVKPIQLPPKAKWYNIYDRDDILGWPLKPTNRAYDKAVTEDIQINAGGLSRSWNPLCHTQYWTDDEVVRRVTDFISETLDSLDEE